MNKILFLLVLAIISASAASAETVVYDNITTSQYKTIKVTSDLCTKIITNCQHQIYIDDLFAGFISDGELVIVPDNTSVLIVLDDPLNTNLENTADTGKSYLTIGIMYFIQPFLIILLIAGLIFFAYRWYRRRRR